MTLRRRCARRWPPRAAASPRPRRGWRTPSAASAPSTRASRRAGAAAPGPGRPDPRARPADAAAEPRAEGDRRPVGQPRRRLQGGQAEHRHRRPGLRRLPGPAQPAELLPARRSRATRDILDTVREARAEVAREEASLERDARALRRSRQARDRASASRPPCIAQRAAAPPAGADPRAQRHGRRAARRPGRRSTRVERAQAAAARQAAATSTATARRRRPIGDPSSAVAKVIAAANQIATTPYVYGGGHGGNSGGYDCSGSVSYALAAAGLVSGPLDVRRLHELGPPGAGRSTSPSTPTPATPSWSSTGAASTPARCPAAARAGRARCAPPRASSPATRQVCSPHTFVLACRAVRCHSPCSPRCCWPRVRRRTAARRRDLRQRRVRQELRPPLRHAPVPSCSTATTTSRPSATSRSTTSRTRRTRCSPATRCSARPSEPTVHGGGPRHQRADPGRLQHRHDRLRRVRQGRPEARRAPGGRRPAHDDLRARLHVGLRLRGRDHRPARPDQAQAGGPLERRPSAPTPTSTHDVTEVSPGIVVTSTEPLLVLDARADPVHPTVLGDRPDARVPAREPLAPAGADDFLLAGGEAIGPRVRRQRRRDLHDPRTRATGARRKTFPLIERVPDAHRHRARRRQRRQHLVRALVRPHPASPTAGSSRSPGTSRATASSRSTPPARSRRSATGCPSPGRPRTSTGSPTVSSTSPTTCAGVDIVASPATSRRAFPTPAASPGPSPPPPCRTRASTAWCASRPGGPASGAR